MTGMEGTDRGDGSISTRMEVVRWTFLLILLSCNIDVITTSNTFNSQIAHICQKGTQCIWTGYKKDFDTCSLFLCLA